MPGKCSSPSVYKKRPRKSNTDSQSLSLPKETIAKKFKKSHAKENKTDISSSDDRTDERKALLPKKMNMFANVTEGKEKSRALPTIKGHSELLKSEERKISKKSKIIKLSSGSKKSKSVGGYDADISFAPDSSPEAKRKTKKLGVEKSSSESVPANGDLLTCEGDEDPGDEDPGDEDPGDTMSDHSDTCSDGDCSDDCEEKCPKNARKPSNCDNLRNRISDDDKERDGDEGDEDESEVDNRAWEMIDNEAVEADSSEDLDESNEGYGIYFESGSTIKRSKATPMDDSYNSAKEQEEMEADDDFVVSDTHIEYDAEDDSWLDDDEPETKRKKYSRIVPSLEDDSSSEDESEWAKLTGRHDDGVVEEEEPSQTGRESEDETTALEQNNRTDNGSDPASFNEGELASGKESSKKGKRGSGKRIANTAAADFGKASSSTGSEQKSIYRNTTERFIGDTSVMSSESPAPEQTRLPLTVVQKLMLIDRCGKGNLLNLARKLIKSERQFLI